MRAWFRRFDLDVLLVRNHRKILVIDGHYAMTGGMNIGDRYMPEAQGGEGWRDDAIWVAGPAAAEMRRYFFRSWRRFRPRYRELTGRAPKLSMPPSMRPTPMWGLRRPSASNFQREVLVLYNNMRGRREIRRFYLKRINLAQRTIYISNSYFVPDRTVRSALCRAARRGVDVRILLPAETDVPPVQYASRRLYGRLLRHGVKIYEYQGSVFHAKSASIDDEWCTVGSYNLDYRSWIHNLEMNVAVADEQTASALRHQFEKDLERARKVELEQWTRRPLKEKALGAFFYMFRRLL